MKIIRILILGVMAIGALTFAMPVQADENVVVTESARPHPRHHRDWEHRNERVIINQSPNYGSANDTNVSVAFGGHSHRHHHHHWHADRD